MPIYVGPTAVVRRHGSEKLTKRDLESFMFEPMSRRTVLKGLGTAMALPFLDAMLPRLATAAPPSATPKRLAFIYVPNGAHMQEWTPIAAGKLGDLPAILKPLA